MDKQRVFRQISKEVLRQLTEAAITANDEVETALHQAIVSARYVRQILGEIKEELDAIEQDKLT